MKIILYQGISGSSKLIRRFTSIVKRVPYDKTYSHAALLLDNGKVVEAWADEITSKKQILPNLPWSLFGHVRGGIRIVDSPSDRHTPGTPYHIFNFKSVIVDEDKVLDCVHRYMDEGYVFDFPGLISYLLPFVKDKKKGVYCSELVIESLRESGVDLLPGDPKVMPTELSFSEYLYKSGEGVTE